VNALIFLIAAAAPARELSLVFLSSRHAAVAPCHCDTAPLGGVDRQVTAVADARQKSKAVLVIDGGNNYFDTADQAALPDAMTRAELIADAQAEMKPDVMVPGTRDFLKGAPALRDLGMRARANWLVSNVSPPTGRATMFVPFVNVKAGDQRVVFLSVYGKSAFPPSLKEEKWTLEEPVAATKRLVAMYKSYADIVVLITHTDGQTEEKIAEQVEGVSIILSAADGKLQFGTRQTGDVQIASAGNLGKYLVRLDLRFHQALPKLEAGMDVQKYFRELRAAKTPNDEKDFLSKGFGLKDTLAFQLLPMAAEITGQTALRERARAIDPVGYEK
jgi:2',3'-cyclic-nucleotide 2'-phosphodiesterase (5'-nucleotidase family)